MPKADTPGESGLASQTLSSQGQEELDLFFNRGLQDVRALDTRVVRDLLTRYDEEIQQAAEVARAEFDKNFGGEHPESGKYGVSRIRSGYFGFDTWDSCPDATLGSTTTWIDNSVPDNLSGSGGQQNPATVGEPVVHIITAIGSHEQSPKAEAVKLRLNDQPRTTIPVEYAFRETDLRYKPLTTPILVKKDDDVFAEFYGGANGAESLYFDGLTFIEEKDYRELDPADMAGTSLEGNIIVE
jgi:hypothetical protein